MKHKAGTFSIFLLIEALIFVGCNSYSDGSNNMPLRTYTIVPATTITISPLTVDQGTPTVTLLGTLTDQPGSYHKLCESISETILNHPPDKSGEEFLSGVFSLCSLRKFSAFDFDEGKVLDKEDKASDLKLEIGKATLENQIIYYLMENNNSLVDEVESSYPSYSECKDFLTSPARLGYIVGDISASGCIQTNQGRLGFFKVTKINPSGQESIEISFVVWNKKK